MFICCLSHQGTGKVRGVGVRRTVCMCVSQKQASRHILQRAPSALPANGKLELHSYCFTWLCLFLLLSRAFPDISNQPKVTLFEQAPPFTLHKYNHPISFLTAHLLPLPFPSAPPLLLVPGWAFVLDQTEGGGVLLWCPRSSWRSPVHGYLFIQPPYSHCSLN